MVRRKEGLNMSYKAKAHLKSIIEHGEIENIEHIFYHDLWCEIFLINGECTCDPEMEIKVIKNES